MSARGEEDPVAEIRLTAVRDCLADPEKIRVVAELSCAVPEALPYLATLLPRMGISRAENDVPRTGRNRCYCLSCLGPSQATISRWLSAILRGYGRLLGVSLLVPRGWVLAYWPEVRSIGKMAEIFQAPATAVRSGVRRWAEA